jgi:hypothetical protein
MSPAFGHGVEDLIFTAVTSGSMEGLGISHATAYPTSRTTLSNVSSPRQGLSNKTAWYDPSTVGRGRAFTAPAPQSMPPTPQTAALPNTLISQPVPIAPHPSGAPLRHGKRLRTDDQYESGRSPQRRRSNSTNQNSQMPGANRPQTELSEEDQLLLKLKHEENLPWKDIAREFESRLGRTYQVPALQMRHKRLRERLRTWTEDDVSALEAAYEYWEKSKFEIIAQKVRAVLDPASLPAIIDRSYRIWGAREMAGQVLRAEVGRATSGDCGFKFEHSHSRSARSSTTGFFCSSLPQQLDPSRPGIGIRIRPINALRHDDIAEPSHVCHTTDQPKSSSAQSGTGQA